MNEEWFVYANGEKSGPMSFADLQAKVQALDPEATGTLVWSASTVEWVPPEKVPGLLDGSPAPTAESTPAEAQNVFNAPIPAGSSPPSSDTGSLNPYAAPQSASPSAELTPGGNHQLELGTVLDTGMRLTNRNFWAVVLFGIVLMGLSCVVAIPGIGVMMAISPKNAEGVPEPGFLAQAAFNLLLAIPMSFLIGGVMIFVLKIIRREEASVSDLFAGGPYFFPMLGAYVIYQFAMLAITAPVEYLTEELSPQWFVGQAFVIIFAVFIALRIGFYSFAIVDQRKGAIEAFGTSWKLTQGNFWSLFGLYIASVGIVLLGALALGLGLIWAMPMVMLAWAASYQNMAYGSQTLSS
ncbi:MAG: GYF domain-containing protein [Verrucomicrobiota bacterium]